MAPIHFRGSIGEQVMECYIFSKSKTHLNLGWPESEDIFSNTIFGVNWFKVNVKSKLTIFILLAHFAIFVVNNSSMQVNPPKNVFAFIIFPPNLKMLLPAIMMGLLWWHQFDDLGMSVTSWTTPLHLSVFISEWTFYFTTSNQFAVEKSSHALHFSHSIFCFSRKYVTKRK